LDLIEELLVEQRGGDTSMFKALRSMDPEAG
jgi:hypothetical protein